MVVVIHQAISIDLNLPEPGHVGEQVEKSLPSFVIDEDIAAGLATVHDVIVRINGLTMPTFYFIVNLVSIAKSGLDPFLLLGKTSSLTRSIVLTSSLSPDLKAPLRGGALSLG
jgi:hypothetical protein